MKTSANDAALRAADIKRTQMKNVPLVAVLFTVAIAALVAIAKQIQTFATNSTGGGPRKIEAGVFVFDKNSAREAVKFGAFDESAIESFANGFSNPSGNTPLGNA